MEHLIHAHGHYADAPKLGNNPSTVSVSSFGQRFGERISEAQAE
jgi:hypothetical protein